jgi:hypothetical protein
MASIATTSTSFGPIAYRNPFGMPSIPRALKAFVVLRIDSISFLVAS